MELVRRIAVLMIGGSCLVACACSASTNAGAHSATNLSGDSALTFTPKSMTAATVHEDCPCPERGGPSSFDAVVVVVSDDPDLQRLCDPGAEIPRMLVTQYRYLTIEMLGTAPIMPGTFVIGSADSPQSVAAGSSAQVVDTYPLTPATSTSYGVADQGTGTATLDAIGSDITGSFDASLSVAGSSMRGVLRGTFDVAACGTIATAPLTPCAQCPGFSD